MQVGIVCLILVFGGFSIFGKLDRKIKEKRAKRLFYNKWMESTKL